MMARPYSPMHSRALKTGRRTIPGFEGWKRFEGREYIVFVDESFYKFFDFTREDGNFVHGAMGVPVCRYVDFQRSMAPTVAQYYESFFQHKGHKPVEIKSLDLYKCEFGERRRFMLGLRSALEATGGFIAGFYTSNRGHVMKHIREELVQQGTIRAVPTDCTSLYESEARKLNSQRAGPGASGIISELLALPVVALSCFLGELKVPFRIAFDPREKDEDSEVISSVDRLMEAFGTFDHKFGAASRFLGVDSTKGSHDELGLQIADVIAGEVRRWFRYNPDLLTAGSSHELVTPEPQDGETVLLGEFGGQPYKKGRCIAIPAPILTRALQSSQDCCLPYLRKSLASGLLTCITDFGTERDVAIFDKLFMDLCD